MDLTKVLFGEDSDNKKDGTHSSLSAADSFSGSTNSGGGNGGGSDDDEKNDEVADGSNTADSHQHDGDHSKTLAKSFHPIPVGVDDDYFKAMAMAIDEIRDEILEQKNQLNDFFTREEERIVSEIKLLEAEMACNKLERELRSKNLEILKATAVSHALYLHSLKIKIQASIERMAQLESKSQVLKTEYEKLRESPPF